MQGRHRRRLAPLVLTLLVAAAPLVAGCAGTPAATRLASNATCGPYTNPFPAPPGDNSFNQRMNLLLSRIKSVCVTVDGHAIADADLAFSIIAGHDNSADAAHFLTAANRGHPRLLPLTDDAYLRAAIANRVLDRLLLEQADAQRLDSSESSSLRASRMRQRLIANVPASQRQARITAWFRDNLSHHNVTITGVNLTVASLPDHLQDGLIEI